MEKKYNIVLGIMLFLFIIVVGVAIAWGLGFVGIKEQNIQADKQDNINKSDNIVANIEDNGVSQKENVTSQNEKVNTLSNATNNVSLLQLDSNKCLNDNDNNYAVGFESGNGYYVRYENGKLKISITKDNQMNDYDISGIDTKNVAEVFLLGRGQDLIYPIAFFLMKDGTVEWLDVEDAVENNDFNCEGKIANVTGVVRIVNAGVSSKNENEPGGWVDVIGIKADGSFYNLGAKVSK